MVMPNTFILGAPKCGTTSICRWMSTHENIYLPRIKEPHYFNSDGLQIIRDLHSYQSLYSGVTPDHVAICDGSTHYLYSKDAVRNITKECHSPKFIVCLRNPVEMAPSLYSERVWGGRENLPTFEAAWSSQGRRLSGESIPSTAKNDVDRLQYGEYCKLGAQLKRLYEQIPRSSVHVVVMDDLKKAPDTEYKKILDFLELPYHAVSYAEHNVRKSVRSINFAIAIRRIRDVLASNNLTKLEVFVSKWRMFNKSNDRSASYVSDSLKKDLQEYFREDVLLLSNLLDRDFSYWLK